MDALLNTPTYILQTCGHEFHRSCLDLMLKNSNDCAICRKPTSASGSIGQMPSGTMSVTYTPKTRGGGCGGYDNDGIIAINFSFPNGKQTQYQPNPGKRFSGGNKVAYLPWNSEGDALLERFKKAFSSGKILVVGTSQTTGQSDLVVYGSIHLKSSQRGGVNAHGWPDPNYFHNVGEELDSQNVPK